MTRSVSPTGSYILDLPGDIVEDLEESCFSYWRRGSELLLQVSSYKRFEGAQVPAEERLIHKLQSQGAADSLTFAIEIPGADCAAATWKDERGVSWLYVFVVWADLTVFLTITGGVGYDPTAESWAIDAARGIRRA